MFYCMCTCLCMSICVQMHVCTCACKNQRSAWDVTSLRRSFTGLQLTSPGILPSLPLQHWSSMHTEESSTFCMLMWKAPEISLPLIYTLPSSCCLRDLKLPFTKLYAQSLSPQRCQKINLCFPACFFLGLWWDTAASSGDLQDGEQQREAHPAGWTLRRPSGPGFRSHLWRN